MIHHEPGTGLQGWAVLTEPITVGCRWGTRKGTSNMIHVEATSPSAVQSLVVVQRLMAETDITEPQASELIAFLGLNWSSLVREAKLLNPTHQSRT